MNDPLTDPLAPLGWRPFFESQRAAAGIGDLAVARVVAAGRRVYRVAGQFTGPAEVSGRFRHGASGPAAFPAVGDWVAVAAEPGARRAVIHHRFDRLSTVSRKAAGRAETEQVLAANVDAVFLVTALAGDLNARRLERYLTTVWEAGAVPVVVLNKADLVEHPEAAAEDLAARLPFVEIVLMSALTGAGLDALRAQLTPARTVVLLGASGAGKSTLVNRLLGAERQRVGAVREGDRKGRHTTTIRELVELPGGALLIDTPGLREIQPWADTEAVAGVFDDIAGLAVRCRFADCTHASEPGCAVLEAVATGGLSQDRLDHYRRLLREAAFEEQKRDKAASANAKRRWRHIHRAQAAMYKDRDRS